MYDAVAVEMARPDKLAERNAWLHDLYILKAPTSRVVSFTIFFCRCHRRHSVAFTELHRSCERTNDHNFYFVRPLPLSRGISFWNSLFVTLAFVNCQSAFEKKKNFRAFEMDDARCTSLGSGIGGNAEDRQFQLLKWKKMDCCEWSWGEKS